MATMRDIKARIGSIRSIQRITRAMKLIATAKLQKAEKAVKSFRAYAETEEEVMKNLANRVEREGSPMFTEREVKRRGVLIITSDRGLCGAFNTKIIQEAELFLNERDRLIAVGKKGERHFSRRNFEIKSFSMPDPVTPSIVNALTWEVISSYLEASFDEAYIIYTKFKAIMKQEVVVKRLLPIPSEEKRDFPDYIYEPNRSVILERLIPHYINTQIFHALLESTASEHAARMVAMDNATKNAEDMVRELILAFNKARQASITKELIEMTTAIEAIRGI
ncbi:MAG: ATP synthase F1 subunit gamma [bacterium]|nr:ATP synthase F1 subunit gamma [bacterium]